MARRLSPISAEALKTIALVLHGEGRGCAPPRQSREIITHALILVRESEGPLDPDAICAWLETEGGLPERQACSIRELALRVARGRGLPGVGPSPLRADILQIWRDRAEGRAVSPFDRLLEALQSRPAAAAL